MKNDDTRVLTRWERLLASGPGQVGGITLAFVLEGLSWVGLTAVDSQAPIGLVYGVVHTLACLIVSWVLVVSLPEPYASQPRAAFALCFFLSFFIPYLGMAGLVLVVRVALRRPVPEEHEDWLFWTEPRLPHSSRPGGSDLLKRPGALVEILQNSRDPHKRVHSVVATRHLGDREAVPVLRVALKDMEDEVRLQAYTFIDRREQTISHKIKEIQAYLEDPDAPVSSSALHARLAHNYWDLVEAGLVQGNGRLQMLEEAESHLREALRVEEDDPGLRLLLGRVLLEAGRSQEAREELEFAGELGLPRELLAPLLAEAAFRERDFQGVRELLGEVDRESCQDPGLVAIVDSWRRGATSSTGTLSPGRAS